MFIAIAMVATGLVLGGLALTQAVAHLLGESWAHVVGAGYAAIVLIGVALDDEEEGE
jgi:hypothetical protein